MFKPGDRVTLNRNLKTIRDNAPVLGTVYEVSSISKDGVWTRLTIEPDNGWSTDAFELYKEPVGSGQVDPTGLDQHQPGAKLDAGKNRVGLVLGAFALALQEVSKVGTFGANKYTDNGWLAVPNGPARYTDALLRHHFQHFSGETHDPESELLHLAHRCWNDLATLELYLRAQKEDPHAQ